VAAGSCCHRFFINRRDRVARLDPQIARRAAARDLADHRPVQVRSFGPSGCGRDKARQVVHGFYLVTACRRDHVALLDAGPAAGLSLMSRPSAGMIPAVPEPPSPNGLPTATTQSPTLASSVGIDLEESDVGLLVAAEHLRGMAAVVLKDYRYLVRIGDFLRGTAELGRLLVKALKEPSTRLKCSRRPV
jgi:hypothetical protein